MQTIKLNGHFSLGAERENKKLRLIVFSNGEEYVCHKTTPGELIRFVNGDMDQLFKGRLQLLNNNGNILVNAKQHVVGIVKGEELEKLIIVE